MDVVFTADGTAYALCGNNAVGKPLWVKLGTPEEVPSPELDEAAEGTNPTGNGVPAFTHQFPEPATK